MNTVVLVDSKNLVYRMHFSHIALSTKDGEPTGLLHGFLFELLRIHKVVPDAAIILCWDGHGATWRHILNATYKSNRKKDPNQLKEWNRVLQQLAVLEPLLEQLGFHSPCIDGVEADDLIGILAEELWKAGKEVRIYSGDKDMYQLVRKRVSVWPGWKLGLIDEMGVEKTFGVRPKDVPEIRAMIGDSSDNLKGLYKIGPKKALQLWAVGLRPSEPDFKKFGELGYRFKEDWARLNQEYKLGKIITDASSKVWTQQQSVKLKNTVRDILERPGRSACYTAAMQSKLYNFLGRWELEELFKVRAEFWQIP